MPSCFRPVVPSLGVRVGVDSSVLVDLTTAVVTFVRNTTEENPMYLFTVF